MEYNGQNIEVPAVLHVSFFKLIDSLEEQVKKGREPYANFAKNLLKEVEPYPELRDGIKDIYNLDKYEEPIQKLGQVIFPDVLKTNEIKALTAMYYGKPLMMSERLESILENSGKPFEDYIIYKDPDLLYKSFCSMILVKHYGFTVLGGTKPLIVNMFNKQQGMTRTYKMLVNVDMVEIIPTEKAVHITEEDFKELINNFDDTALWKQKFPPNSWIIRGVTMLNFIDITIDNSITEINRDLLTKSQQSFDNIRDNISKVLGIPSLSVGVLTIENDSLVIASGDERNQSVLLGDNETFDCYKEMGECAYDTIIVKKEPYFITDISEFHAEMDNAFSKRLYESGYKSFMLAPLINEGEFLGYIELGSQKAYALHKGIFLILDSIIPILSMAFKQFEMEMQNAIEAVIQQECTTIHSSVKWRFEEEAERFIEEQFNGKHPEFSDIIFNKLYPLYGQLDIKGSSQRRNDAVSTDLTKQLIEINKVLKVALDKTQMPIFEELVFRNDNFIHELNIGFAAGSEHKILGFVKQEIYPVFEHLKRIDGEISALIQDYFDLLDSELHTIYEARKEYDTSVNYINHRLATFLDKKQEEAQKMHPHYFERYKTDGVEYNIYIGESIAKNKKFDQIYLKNLRLWQLITMCEMEFEFRRIQQELNSTIEVASLILVYNTPISVHFRMDEKQFDIEGAYNARYEIIKKRVDKARIKETNERITQPQKLAIIYSQDQDAHEYRQYLEYLVNGGYIKEEIESVELEDLQGVSGLKALRVTIRYDKEDTEKKVVVSSDEKVLQ